MRITTLTDTFSGVPSAWDSEDYSYYSLTNPEYAYADTSSGEYANLRATIGNGVSSWAYLLFDVSSIPANATIDSISCLVKARAYTATYVSGTVQLYTGSTAKGQSYTLSNSTTAFSLTCGSWTRSELNDIKLKFVATRKTTSTSTAYGLRIHGATLTIGYTYNQVYCTVTVTNSSSAGVYPLGEAEYTGGTNKIYLDRSDNIKVYDNDVDVTDELSYPEQSNLTFTNNITSIEFGTRAHTFSTSSLVGNGSDSTSYVSVYATSGVNAYYYLYFDFRNSIIQDVEDFYVEAKCSSSRSDDTHFITLWLGNGVTSTRLSDSVSVSSLDVYTVKLNSASASKANEYFYGIVELYVLVGTGRDTFYGATAYVKSKNTVYSLSLTEDHTIHVKEYAHYLKIGGAWRNIKNIWVKHNGQWAKDSSFEFNSRTRYIDCTDYSSYPFDAKVEYIKSSGTEYIDTGYRPTLDTHIIMRAAYKGVYDTVIDLQNGSMKSESLRYHWGICTRTSDSITTFYFACGNKYAHTIEHLDTNIHTFELWGYGQFRIDGRTSYIGDDITDAGDNLGTTTKSITLFGRNDASSVGELIDNMELYSFKIYESDALMMDLIPVRVGQTGYLYDRKSKQLFGNEGTGNFVLGNDVQQTKYYAVDYLESTGTQYIDLNIIPDAETGIYIKATNSNNTDTYICGLRDTTGNTRWCIGHSSNGYYYGYGGWAYTSPAITSLTAESTLNYLNDKKFRSIDENNITGEVDLPTLSFTPTNGIRLFGSSGVGASYAAWLGKIYNVKVSQGSNIVLNLIPVRIGQVGYMYDTISERFFGNKGTGRFKLGDDITI